MFDEIKFASRFVTVQGEQMHFLEAGEGPPVIFIHGSGAGASGISNFRRNLSLADGRRMIILDLPGYGKSPNREVPEGIYDGMASWVRDALDEMGIEKANFVGNSLGGGIALRIALDVPERVDRLVLMGCGGSLPVFSVFPTDGLMGMIRFYDDEGPTLEKLRRILEKLVYDHSMINDELLQERLEGALRPDVMSNPPLRGRGANPKDDLWREPLYGVQHETLLVWGREDRIIPLDAAFILLKALPNARLHVLPKCGHWAQWEKAEEFNGLVDRFLART